MRVLICGGGIIGACTAYFLGRRGAEAIVIERTALACAASGKAGGFLALDWCDGSPLEQLARRSFNLHQELAAEIDGDWGFRGLATFGGAAGLFAGGLQRTWLADDVVLDRRLGTPETTAQVHPGRFTEAMMCAAEALGAELRRGEVQGVLRSEDGSRVSGVVVDGQAVEGDAVVIAMGPWSLLASAWLPLPAVYGSKGHSLVYETGERLPAEALFLEAPRTERSGAFAGDFRAPRRNHLGLRHIQPEPAPS
jgi:glycine/D-amino acid oxidase-like deaminating enzyme